MRLLEDGGYRISELITDDISKVNTNGMYYYADMKGVFQPIKIQS